MIQGSLVALVTPMHESGEVDTESLKKLVEFHIEQGTDGLVAVGTTGESATLNEQEHCAVIRAVVDLVDDRIPVIAGTGANSTTEAIALTRAGKAAGATACLLVTPYYNKPTQEGLYRHYKTVAETVDIDQILYNVPSRTACDMLPETIARLAPIDNIIGVKEATADLSRIAEIRAACGAKFALYSGDDATTCKFCLQGGNGVITVTGNVAPRLMHDMVQAAMDNDRDMALSLDAQLAGLHKHLFIQANPIPVKWAMTEMGLIGKGIRLPMTWLTEDCFAPVRSAMVRAGIN